MPMEHQYNLLLVVLSYAVSVLGSFTALQLAVGIPLARSSRQRMGAVISAALAMGGGAIWAMHFIAMLACQMPVAVTYDAGLTLLSALLAVGACGVGLALSGLGVFSWTKLVGAGTLMGLGVAGMHYLGMSAMLMPATISYDGGLVVLSVVIAVFASIVALWLAFNLRGKWQMFGSALVMGVAVCGMHYTGMLAAAFVPADAPAAAGHGLQAGNLGMSVFVIAVVLLAVALGISFYRQKQRTAVSI